MAEIHRIPEIVTLAELLSYLGLGESADDKTVAQVATIKRGAEAAVRKYLRCGVVRATYTNYLPKGHPFDFRATGPLLSQDGRSTKRYYLGVQILLPQFPIRSITTIHEDRGGRFGQVSGSFASDSLLTAGTDYTWPIIAEGFGRAGAVHRHNTQWSSEPGSIKVVYVAGWTKHELHGDTDEHEKDATPIRMGTLRAASEYWNDKKQAEAAEEGAPGPIKSESLADYAVAYDTTGGGANVQLPKDVKIELLGFQRSASVRAIV